MIRVPGDFGAAEYDGAMQRLEQQGASLPGMLIHLTAARAGDFVGWTAFRDRTAMRDSFLAVISPAMDRLASQGGRGDFNFERDEYPLERLYIEPGFEASEFGLVDADGLVARTNFPLKQDLENYHRVSDEVGWFDRPAEGRIAHIAYSDPSGGIFALEVWRSRAAGQQWYDEHVTPEIQRTFGLELTAEMREQSWFELHSAFVTEDAADLNRHFVRTQPGPSEI